MSQQQTPVTKSEARDFAEEAEAESQGLLGEIWGFLWESKKWWMTPIILVLLMLGALMALSSSVAAPFIYTLF